MPPLREAPPSPETRSGREGFSRAANAAWWLLPVVFLIWLYRDAFSTWFFMDDFAWLSLGHLVHTRHDLLHELFAPMAQGTIRPWSERGFFMLLQSLFGLDNLPFRLVVFATAACDVLLIAWLTLRITGSRIAGFVAPILWTANTALVLPMAWSSAYNEIMCPMFLLGALALFIRYAETGKRGYWWWQLVVFSLGFGALEINVVYPALAAAWLLLATQPPNPELAQPANPAHTHPPNPASSQLPNPAPAPLQSRDREGAVRPLHSNSPVPTPTLLRALIPQFLISIAYFALHRYLAPLPATGPYALHLDASILKTIALYCKWTLVPEPIDRFGHSHHLAGVVLLIGTAAIGAFVAAELKRRRYTLFFYLGWFIVTLAPMLPLPNHRTDYYLTIPLIGIAMLGGVAAGQYWNGPWTRRALVLIPISAYLWAMIPVTAAVTHWWLTRSQSVRTLVLGVSAAHASHPGKAIVLDAITTELFDLSLAHSPFVAASIDNVYLTPGSELTVTPSLGNASLQDLVLEPEVMWHALTHGDAVVYSLESDHLRNITEGYTRRISLKQSAGRSVDRLPSHLDIGNFLYSWLLGPEWLPPESGIRWMPGSATLRIGVPVEGSQLELFGRCPKAQLSLGPRHLMVLVDGVTVGDTRIYDPENDFHRLFPVSAVLAGKKSVEVEIRVDPVDLKDGQDYGLVFGNVAIRP